MDANSELKRTPFYDIHVRIGGRMVPFGGWEMPVQYEGIVAEHTAVRTAAGLFDVSHMGEVEVKGKQAFAFVQNLVANNVAKIQNGQCQYTPMCNEKGGIVDDLLVYRHDQEHFMLVINASNIEKDFAWMKAHNPMQAELRNISSETAELALQGPKAQAILQQLTDFSLDEIKYFWFSEFQVANIPMLVSRTGYTGEDGFELYFDPRFAEKAWEALFEVGKGDGLKPAGLGARDSLRLEAGLMLYGNDLDDDTTPLEAPLKWTVDLSKEFVGRRALLEKGPRKKLTGFELLERAVPRHGNKVVVEGREQGVVTSGGFSPTLQKSIGFAYIPPKPQETIGIVVREGKVAKAKCCSTRFYKREK